MVDPDMDKQIEVIKMMVESYLKIVGKTIRDITPKYIMLLLVIHVSTRGKIIRKVLKTENDFMTPTERHLDVYFSSCI